MVCQVDGELCGRGVCQNSTCVCEPGWASQGDFLRNSECQAPVQVNKALWATGAVLWLLVLLGSGYALIRLERRTKQALLYEIGVLTATIIGGICYVVAGFLETSASFPGARSVGIDPVTTGFFAIGNLFVWLFICLNPLSKSQTGVGSLALARVKKVREVYLWMVPLLVLLGVTTSSLPVVALYVEDSSAISLVSAYFALTAIIVIVVGVMTAVSFWVMVKDFSKTLNSSARELPPSHRAAVERLAKSAKKLVLIPAGAVLLLTPFLIFCASGAFNDQVSISLPLTSWMGAFWLMRYVNRSIRATAIVRDKDREKTTHHTKPNTADVDTNNSSGNGKPATDSNSSSISSTAGKQRSGRSRKTFRLKGFRSKPMQLMSHVTEGNSEGTVRFTEVDGVETMNTSSGRYSRPITLSTKLDTSPRPGHKSVSSVQATLWEVDINGTTETHSSEKESR